MSTSNSLPVELVLHILSSLSDQPKAIQNCALVSRNWSIHSQAYVFRTITLRSLNQCNNLLACLVESPHIAPLVRDISFNFEIREHDDTSSIAATIYMLECIQSLAFGRTAPMKRVIPNDVPVSLLDALAAAIARPSFSTLKLNASALGFFELQSLFRYASSLKHLSLMGISCQYNQIQPQVSGLLRSNDTDHSLTLPGTYPEEVVLDLKDDTVVGKWMCHPECSVKLTRLRSLSIIYHRHVEHHEREVTTILQNAGMSLERLYVKRNKAQALCQDLLLDLTPNCNLRSLRLDLAPKTHYEASICPPIYILTTVSHLSLSYPPLAIEELIIDINIIDSESYKRANHTRWRQLGTILSKESFPNLKLVKFVLSSPIRHVGLLEEMVKRELPTAEAGWRFDLEDRAGPNDNMLT